MWLQRSLMKDYMEAETLPKTPAECLCVELVMCWLPSRAGLRDIKSSEAK